MEHLQSGPVFRGSAAVRIESTRAINNSLIRCKILLECGSTVDFIYGHFLSQGQGERSSRPIVSGSGVRAATALSHADYALDLASFYDQPQLVAKSQLFRGHCFRRMAQWDKAYWCYIRAASVREFAADKGPEGLEASTKECQSRLGRRKESHHSSSSEEINGGYGLDVVVVREDRISSHTFGSPNTQFLHGDGISNADCEASSRQQSSMKRDFMSTRPSWMIVE